MGKLTPHANPVVAAAQRVFHAYADRNGNDALADALGISRRTAVRICAGEKLPPPGMAIDFAHTLDAGNCDDTRTASLALFDYADLMERPRGERPEW